MNPTPQLQRALLLYQQGRHELAEKDLRQHLAGEPTDGLAHALLAIALLEQARWDDAEQSARDAVGHAPDQGFSHYALARVMSARGQAAAALAAIQESIRLEPTEADYHSAHAAMQFDRERWTEALAAAETGLQFDAEHVGCNNLRAMSLVKLGRTEEASETIRATLARDPDNTFSHANQGWTLLDKGDRRPAMEHFRESLRLDPTNDWARAGLVEAMKAGNPLYAVMLRYFLWMQKLSSGARWGIILGGYFGSRMLGGLADSHPTWAAWIVPLQIIYVVFALLTWLSRPIFNLMLFAHPMGRHALSDPQRTEASWVGACLLLGLGFLGAAFGLGQPRCLLAALVFGVLAIPLSAVFSCSTGWPRWTMLGITLLLAVTGITALSVLVVMNPPVRSFWGQVGLEAFRLYFLGAFLSLWAANLLMLQRPRR